MGEGWFKKPNRSNAILTEETRHRHRREMYRGPERPEQTQTSWHQVASISLECDPRVMDVGSRSGAEKEEHFGVNSLRSSWNRLCPERCDFNDLWGPFFVPSWVKKAERNVVLSKTLMWSGHLNPNENLEFFGLIWRFKSQPLGPTGHGLFNLLSTSESCRGWSRTLVWFVSLSWVLCFSLMTCCLIYEIVRDAKPCKGLGLHQQRQMCHILTLQGFMFSCFILCVCYTVKWLSLKYLWWNVIHSLFILWGTSLSGSLLKMDSNLQDCLKQLSLDLCQVLRLELFHLFQIIWSFSWSRLWTFFLRFLNLLRCRCFGSFFYTFDYVSVPS